MSYYTFLSHLFIRSAATPIEQEYTTEYFERVFEDEEFRTALLLASPGLLQSFETGETLKEKDLRKLRYALSKYALRYSSRPTPFGLFAGFGSLSWGETTRLQREKGSYVHSRLDLAFLCELSDKLATHPDIEPHLLFTPNTTLYRVGMEYRYYEYQTEDGQRKYKISALEADDTLNEVLHLASNGISRLSLAGHLMHLGFDDEDISYYLDELIQSRILVHDLEPNLTGEDFLKRINQTLRRIATLGESEFLNAMLDLLSSLEESLKNAVQPDMEELQILLQKVSEIPVNQSKVLHLDKYDNWGDSTLDDQIKRKLLKAIRILKALEPAHYHSKLEAFKQQFIARYEEQEVPLLIALDVDTGIGFGSNTGVSLPLTDHLHLPRQSEDNSITLNDAHQKLIKWLLENSVSENNFLDLQQLFKPVSENELDFPPSLSLGFRMISDEELFLENIGGESGANIIGRFGEGNTKVKEALQEIHAFEQAQNPEVLFAEVVHLPDGHLGNVLKRSAFRPSEIVFLACPGSVETHVIRLQNLRLSVRGNKFILRDEVSGKRVIPRLGSAFNYSMNTLPVFEFLCSLQNEGHTTALGFSWGPLQNLFDRFPRVKAGDVTVYPAQWIISEKEFESKFSLAKLQELLSLKKVTTRFVFSVGDQELLADLHNEWLLEILLDEIKNHKQAILKEFLHNELNPVFDSKGNKLAHQFVATLGRSEALFLNNSASKMVNSHVQREFSPVSDWLYFKIYGGYRSLEQVLLRFYEITSRPEIDKALKQWFFIRYADPNPHLRLRIQLRNLSDHAFVLSSMGHFLDACQSEQKVAKWSVEPYVRELERYGSQGIELAENLFFKDSVLVCKHLSLLESENERWIQGMKNIDFFLDAMSMDLLQKRDFIGHLRDAFMEEFGGSGMIKPQIDPFYREHKTLITNALNQSELTKEEFTPELRQMLQKFQKASESENHWLRIAGSILHLHINRLMPAEQRKQELVIYDFLFKFYTTKLAIERKSTT